MSNILWILLLVLFSLPSLLGKKDKRGNRGHKPVVSSDETPQAGHFTDVEQAVGDFKRHILGQDYKKTEPVFSAPKQEQFLYEEYDSNSPEKETEKTAQELESLRPEPESENGTFVGFNLRDAVVQSVILENHYIN
ncbi:MAG: hypothetical protein IJP95_02665 [Bacteroidales bacterium]|nr:hypothetical protein [Bacteroidales bacterium]